MPVPAVLTRISWGVALQVLREGFQRGSAAWETLGPNGRQRARQLISKSHGNPRNLTERERKELLALAKSAGSSAVKGKRK